MMRGLRRGYGKPPYARGYRSRLIRAGIVGATLCVLPAVGLLTAKLPPALVLVALVVPFGLVAVMRRVELGIAAMLVAGVFVRFRIPTGTASEIVISLVICVGCIALWIMRMLVVERRLVLKTAATNLPLLGFMATVPVSWVWSRVYRDLMVREVGHPLVSVVAGLVMVLLPGCFLLVANNVRRVCWLQALVWILLGEGLVILIIDLGYFLDVGAIRAVHTLLSTNGVVHVSSQGLISMWCLAFALALALFNRELHWMLRASLLVYAGAWVYWGFVIRILWLSGWVPAFVAATVIAFLRSKRLFIVVVVVALVAVGWYYWRTAYEGEMQESGTTRLAAYVANWRITSRHVLLGTGPAGYASYYMTYFPTEAMASHSNYIDVLAQTGIVGSALYLWFFGAQMWGGYKLRLALRGRGDFAESLTVAVLAGTAGCLIAMALGDWLLPFAYTQGIIGFDLAMLNWLFMGALWALRYNLESQGSKTHTTSIGEEDHDSGCTGN